MGNEKDKNEMIIVDLPTNRRVELYGQVTSQMEKLGFSPYDYKALGLGFDLPADWPYGDNEITLAQLVVLAKKLKMRIVITELFVEPHKEAEPKAGD